MGLRTVTGSFVLGPRQTENVWLGMGIALPTGRCRLLKFVALREFKYPMPLAFLVVVDGNGASNVVSLASYLPGLK